MTKEERAALEKRLLHAKTKEEYVSIGVRLFQPLVDVDNLEEVLAENWEEKQRETPAERRRRKWEAFWWKVTKPLRLIADGGLDIAILIAFIALIIAAIALFRPAQ
jgi:guanosine-3,5-bis(diphosphate) 3-diphosphatase, (ppGpp)ase